MVSDPPYWKTSELLRTDSRELKSRGSVCVVWPSNSMSPSLARMASRRVDDLQSVAMSITNPMTAIFLSFVIQVSTHHILAQKEESNASTYQSSGRQSEFLQGNVRH